MLVKSNRYQAITFHDLGVRFKDGYANVPDHKIAALLALDVKDLYGFEVMVPPSAPVEEIVEEKPVKKAAKKDAAKEE